MTADESRREIEKIDKQLLGLFAKRLDITGKICGERTYAALCGSPQEDAGNGLPEEYGQYAASLMSFVSDLSRSHLRDVTARGDGTGARFLSALRLEQARASVPRVAVQGVPGSYAGIAAKKLHPGGRLIFFETWEDVFIAVGKGGADYGVLPVENSTAGSVLEVYDLLLKYRFYINRACRLAVDHCLLGVRGASEDGVKDVYSHPQAFSQCREFIKAHGYDKHVCLNTAAAAKMVAQSGDVTKAAIASSDCAGIYGLDVIRSSIQQQRDNRTRFISVSKSPETSPGADRISLVFALPHQTGSLYRILARFAHGGHNLTKIESRPVPDRPFEYYFYVDFCGSVCAEKTAALLGELQNELPFFHFLGNYGETEA